MVEDNGPVLPLGSFLFPRIFQAFRMSIQPSKLAIAFLALAAICLTGWVMDFNRTVVVPDRTSFLTDTRTITTGRPTELDIYIRDPAAAADLGESKEGDRAGVFSTLWRFGSGQFHEALYSIFALDIPGVMGHAANGIRALVWAFRYHPVYSIIFFMVALAVLSLAGGAICRIAALQFAQADRPGLVQALRFALRKFVALLAAPITPLVIILVVGLLIALLGLVGNIPIVGELMVGTLLPLALFAAALIAIILIGTVAGLNLMLPAVAYEDADSFDAISRSFSCVYARPWRMGFYTLIAVLYGAVCYVFVRFLAFVLLWITYRFLQLGFIQHNAKLEALWAGPTFTDFFGPAAATSATWSVWLGALLVRLWVLAVVGLMVSFLISFYFSANTIIYALMRNRVDGTPLEEVYTAPDESTLEPAPPAGPAEAPPSARPRSGPSDRGPTESHPEPTPETSG